MLIQTIHPNLAIELLYLHTQADGNLWSLSTLLNKNHDLLCKLDSLFWPLGHMCVSNGTIHPILAKLSKGILPEIKSETRKKFLDKFYFISKGKS